MYQNNCVQLKRSEEKAELRKGQVAMDKYDVLKLENQVCFPLYACAKEVVRRYKPYLDELELTYTQYITMMVMWEKKSMNVKELGQCLYLDSGTMTPVLKALEKKGYVVRNRSKEDERVVIVEITEVGMALRDQAVEIPIKLGSCISVPPEDMKRLYELLYQILGNFEN